MERRADALLGRGRYLGHTLRAERLDGLTLTETAYPPGAALPPHAHETPYCCLVLRGGFEETLGGRTRTRRPATLIVHPAGEVHANRFGAAEGRCFNIEVGFGAERLGGLEPFARPAAARDGGAAWLAQRMYREFRSMDALSPLVLEGLALALAAETGRGASAGSRGAPPPWLARAAELVRDRCRTAFTLGEVAAAAGVHPTHLARAFRRHYGRTVGEYARALRVEWASARLAESAVPLSVVALEAGFADQSHFTRVFRRATGTTPAEYRRTHRGR
ncbi:MAG TPA: AraC family transcriptional regulator [Longimicrobium sp.]|nr:AraC family transcriptional regulator [Longimicrobium sp.]